MCNFFSEGSRRNNASTTFRSSSYYAMEESWFTELTSLMYTPLGKKLPFQEFQSNAQTCHVSSNEHYSPCDLVLQCLLREINVNLRNLLSCFLQGQHNDYCRNEGWFYDIFVYAPNQKITECFLMCGSCVISFSI